MKLQVKGLAELEAQLKELGAELGAKTLRTAARKAFKPVLEAAKARAPVDTGALRDAIQLTASIPKSGESVVVVGLKVAKAKPRNAGARRGRAASTSAEIERSPHYRWRFAELGTAHQAAKPFLRPALDANAESVVNALRDDLVKGIARALKKRGGR